LSFASRLEQASRSAPEPELRTWAAELEQRWHAELLPHFAVEERLWLPALTTAGLGDLTWQTAIEHRTLAALMANRELPLREKLLRFGALLHAHVRFEERELFQAAQRALAESELAALADAMADQGAPRSVL